MPELPEVETLKCYLEKHILGKKVHSFLQTRENLRYKLAGDIKEQIMGAIIKDIIRIAKYIVINLDNEKSLIVHLGMSGRFTIQPANYLLKKHDHIIIYLSDNIQMIFNDARRFGMVYCYDTKSLYSQQFLKHLGLEPLSDKFNPDYLQKNLNSRKSAIKTAIMNNTIVVGVGNIYASESLFLAKINPTRPACSLSFPEIILLVESIKIVLNKAIKAGGTTLKNFVSGDSKPGYFKQQLNVYDRDKNLCYLCNFQITKIKQAGRTTFCCLNCQK